MRLFFLCLGYTGGRAQYRHVNAPLSCLYLYVDATNEKFCILNIAINPAL